MICDVCQKEIVVSKGDDSVAYASITVAMPDKPDNIKNPVKIEHAKYFTKLDLCAKCNEDFWKKYAKQNEKQRKETDKWLTDLACRKHNVLNIK